MAALARPNRLDASSVRLVASVLGTVLGVIWVLGLVLHASTWLTWMVAFFALGCYFTLALVPESRPALVAAANLALVATGLGACWIVALALGSTTWLTWCCFGAAGITFVGALGTALGAFFDQVS